MIYESDISNKNIVFTCKEHLFLQLYHRSKLRDASEVCRLLLCISVSWVRYVTFAALDYIIPLQFHLVKALVNIFNYA